MPEPQVGHPWYIIRVRRTVASLLARVRVAQVLSIIKIYGNVSLCGRSELHKQSFFARTRGARENEKRPNSVRLLALSIFF